MSGTPVTDQEREQIRQLHGEGKSAYAIAKRLGRSPATVSTHAESLGLSFDRAPMAAANKARRAAAETRRRDLAENLLDDAERLRQRMWSPYSQIQYVGPQGVRRVDDLESPPPKEMLDYARAMQIAVTQTMKLVDFDREKDDQRLAMADRFLTAMMGGDPDAGDG